MSRLAVMLAIGLVSVAHRAQATPIMYTDTVTGTGALGAVPFTSALVTISLIGDTSTVFGDPVPRDFGSAIVNVSGVGTATFADPLMWAIDNPGARLGRWRELLMLRRASFFWARAMGLSHFTIFGVPSDQSLETVVFNPGVLFPTTL